VGKGAHRGDSTPGKGCSLRAVPTRFQDLVLARHAWARRCFCCRARN